MSFHHVLVALKSDPKKLRCIFSDLTEEQLGQRFLKPYRRGENIACDRETIIFSQIHRLRIIRTEQPNAAERDAYREKIFKEIEKFNWQSDSVVLFNVNRGASPEDILKIGEDVTAVVIAGPLGRE
jgi:hypothetical protein